MDPTLAQVDEAIVHVRSSLAVAIRAHDERVEIKHRARMDRLLDTRSRLTRDRSCERTERLDD